MYKEKNYCDVLDEAILIGERLCQGKDDFDSGSILYSLYLAHKKNVLTINEYGVIQGKNIFKGCNDSKRLLDRSQYFKRIEGKKISAILPKSRKKHLLVE